MAIKYSVYFFPKEGNKKLIFSKPNKIKANHIAYGLNYAISDERIYKGEFRVLKIKTK